MSNVYKVRLAPVSKPLLCHVGVVVLTGSDAEGRWELVIATGAQPENVSHLDGVLKVSPAPDGVYHGDGGASVTVRDGEVVPVR